MAEADISPRYRTLCSHYTRGCSLLAPCCGKLYPCRVCHDEAEEHKMDRKLVVTIQCRNCNELQKVTNKCTKCLVVFGNAYFCQQCRLFDDLDKKQYHCDDCTICRVGGRENYFHCSKCNLCWLNSLRDTHKCKTSATNTLCPVCMEDVHSARVGAIVLPCSHYLHNNCYTGLLENGLYKCPLCNTSMVNMKQQWQRMDEEKKEWSMPRRYRNFHVQVLCQDCHETTTTRFHVIGLKCESCGSYNTSRSGNEEVPNESAEEEEESQEDDEIYNDDHVRIALLRQRLGAIIRHWGQPAREEENNDDGNDDGNDERDEQQRNTLNSIVNQLQLFQGMLNEFSGQHSDVGSDESESPSDSEQSHCSHSERSDHHDDDDDDDEHERSSVHESVVSTEDSDDGLDADDEDDSSHVSSPSYSYLSQPHAVNLSEIYGEDGRSCESDRSSNSSGWETEEEQELIGEVGDSNWGDSPTHTVQGTSEIANLSGSLGSFTLEDHSDTDDSSDGLPVIPPLHWNRDTTTSVIFPINATGTINPFSFTLDNGSDDESNTANCSMQ